MQNTTLVLGTHCTKEPNGGNLNGYTFIKFSDFKLVTAVTKCLLTLGNREPPFSVCDCEKVVLCSEKFGGRFCNMVI